MDQGAAEREPLSAVEDLLTVELNDGRLIFVFDGLVLEMFGRVPTPSSALDSARLHVKQLTVRTSEPDKKGLRRIEFVGPQNYARRFELDGAGWSSIQPLLEALREAGAEVA